MRLGFWNRLALVIGVLVTLVTPTALVWYVRQEIYHSRYEAFDTCLAERVRLDDISMDCLAISGVNTPINVGWADWREYLLGSLLVFVLLYLLIAATVWVARWVWRGRSVKP